MILKGEFVLISVESRESNGKVYHNVNLESDDGKVSRIGVDAEVVPVLDKKYQKYEGFFNIGTYDGKMFMRLVEARSLAGK